MNPLFLLAMIGLSGGPIAPELGQDTPHMEATVPAAEANEVAERLRDEAYGLFGDRRTWRRAARLLERSAELRSTDDPARTEAYRMAGRVYTHLGALDAAQRAFERAALSAARIGAVADAAAAYLDAAQVAAHRNDARAARTLIEKGALLAQSPHLSSAERAAITRRIPARPLTG